jgi:hypothetical protein
MLVLLDNLSSLWLFFTFYQEKEKKRCIFQSKCGPRRVLERYRDMNEAKASKKWKRKTQPQFSLAVYKFNHFINGLLIQP